VVSNHAAGGVAVVGFEACNGPGNANIEAKRPWQGVADEGVATPFIPDSANSTGEEAQRILAAFLSR
jgi:hypothetical protein